MSLSALAAQAGVAKSTVSLIERGRGNPSLDTISSLASALEVPFAALLREESTLAEVSVVREGQARLIALGPDDEQEGVLVRHLLTRASPGSIELYSLRLQPGATRRSEGHAGGTFMHISVTQGSVEIAGEGFSEVLGGGDLISFRADRPHTCTVLEGPAGLLCIREHPRPAQG